MNKNTKREVHITRKTTEKYCGSFIIIIINKYSENGVLEYNKFAWQNKQSTISIQDKKSDQS